MGQWIGEINGTNQGSVILNVDHDRPEVGWFQVDDSVFPFVAGASDLKVSDSGIVTASIGGFLPQPYFGQEQVMDQAEVQFPISGTLKGQIVDQVFSGTWTTDAGTTGHFTLERADSSAARPADHLFSWAEFKKWAFESQSTRPQAVFRGHFYSSDPLITRFHQTGRRSLQRYALNDLPRLQRYVEQTLGKRFRLEDPLDYGAFLNLAQHHGFPTPLQDWTESPFIAAFFAFREKSSSRRPRDADAKARVFSLDLANWPSLDGVTSIGDVRPLFQQLRLGASDNPRALPQQSVNIFSNVVDIERLIEHRSPGLAVVQRIDIPISERETVMRELRMMGITAASLFPGLDGVCQALSEASFG